LNRVDFAHINGYSFAVQTLLTLTLTTTHLATNINMMQSMSLHYSNISDTPFITGSIMMMTTKQ